MGRGTDIQSIFIFTGSLRAQTHTDRVTEIPTEADTKSLNHWCVYPINSWFKCRSMQGWLCSFDFSPCSLPGGEVRCTLLCLCSCPAGFASWLSWILTWTILCTSFFHFKTLNLTVFWVDPWGCSHVIPIKNNSIHTVHYLMHNYSKASWGAAIILLCGCCHSGKSGEFPSCVVWWNVMLYEAVEHLLL